MDMYLLGHIHRTTHLGPQKIEDLFRRSYLKVFSLRDKIEQVASKCLACWLVNAKPTGGQTSYSSKHAF